MVHPLLEAIKPFYPKLQSTPPRSTVQSLLKDVIRRIPNPDFQRTNLKEPRLASEYLYDETDVKLYIAKERGGYECRLQAILASNELGLLRDSRFVIPALENDDYNLRLTAVACLAFLPSTEGNKKLRKAAADDVDAGVRQSALWAYGFVDRENALEFIKERSVQDKDSRVKRFAKELLNLDSKSWVSF